MKFSFKLKTQSNLSHNVLFPILFFAYLISWSFAKSPFQVKLIVILYSLVQLVQFVATSSLQRNYYI